MSARFRGHWLLVAAMVVVIAGCRADTQPPCPTCAAARLTNQWCDACQVGYVAGVAIRKKMLFEWLDAHGHELDLASVKCATCQAGIAKGGFCEACRIGWVNKLGYFSRLTYHLAKGMPCDPATLSCRVCRRNSEHHGWCQSCGVGMVGNVAIATRADFEGGVRGYELMCAANEASKRCENCALAIMNNERCFFCRIAYREGKAIQNTALPG